MVIAARTTQIKMPNEAMIDEMIWRARDGLPVFENPVAGVGWLERGGNVIGTDGDVKIDCAIVNENGNRAHYSESR
jgi:hypothetical protein